MSNNKYKRNLKGVQVDVYDVLKAFDVTCPAMQHAAKKVLCAGIRGHKDALKDKREAIQSIERSIELEAPAEPLPVPPADEFKLEQEQDGKPRKKRRPVDHKKCLQAFEDYTERRNGIKNIKAASLKYDLCYSTLHHQFDLIQIARSEIEKGTFSSSNPKVERYINLICQRSWK